MSGPTGLLLMRKKAFCGSARASWIRTGSVVAVSGESAAPRKGLVVGVKADRLVETVCVDVHACVNARLRVWCIIKVELLYRHGSLLFTFEPTSGLRCLSTITPNFLLGFFKTEFKIFRQHFS